MKIHKFWLRILLSVLLTGATLLLVTKYGVPTIANMIQYYGITSGEAGFLAIYPATAVLSCVIFLVIYILIRIDKPGSWKEYLAVQNFDVKGVVYTFLILGLFNLAEIAFLNQILKPVEGFLTSLGLPSSPTLGSLPKQYLFLNMVVLALFWWLEVPEELFFRGYIQNRLQGEHGKNISMLLSALIWDIWHVHGPAQCLRRFFVGLILAFAFRWRQNSYPTMLVHSIGNRVGTAIILLLR